MSTAPGCRRARSGLGDGFLCTVHGTPWPCRADAGQQLALLVEESEVADAVLTDVLAERVRALGIHPSAKDDALDAYGWVALLVDRINVLNGAGRRLAEQEMTTGRPDVTEWLQRLVELAGVAVAAAESAERYRRDVNELGGPER